MNEIAVYYTNSLDALARRLAADLCAAALPPLQTETIVVPSEGMAYWLRLRLAALTGCAAGVSMVFPGNFCQHLSAGAQRPQFRGEDLLWQIYAHLVEPAFIADFAPLSAYLQDRDPLKPLQLARRLCALFQNYLVYRHDMLLRWEAGQTGPASGPGALAHEDWQAALWRGLRDVPRAADFQWVLDDPRSCDLPPRLCVFGAGTLPPLFLRLLQRLAQFLPVRLYLPAPTPHYWGDIRSGREMQRMRLAQMVPQMAQHAAAIRQAEDAGALHDSVSVTCDCSDGSPAGASADGVLPPELHYDCGNPLLADLGRQGREFFVLLAAATGSGQGWQELEWDERGEGSVLSVLQQDIRDLYERGQGGQSAGAGDAPPEAEDDRLPFDPADQSLQLHCCHSPLREVEVLHDRLLDALACDPTLEPADILVLMTSPQDYAPWVEAVFGSSAQLRQHYRLADYSAAECNPVAQALMQVLALAQGRQTAPEVLALLDLQPVREAAGLAAPELPKLRQLVQSLNIRWGMSNDASARTHGVTAGGAFSWLDGLDRLLMGYAAGGVEEVICGIAPARQTGDLALAGRFAAWVQQLFDWCAVLTARPRPLEEWRRLINQLCRDLLGETGSDEDAGEWLHLPPLPGDTAVPLETVREYLRGELQAPGGKGAFIGGGISFCALRPLRSVPFRVIAVLGLDYTRFPRRDRREAFDLMRGRPLFGDRNLRDDDCQLFLETLLSARERLILTYSGRSDIDLSLRPASVCVSMLLATVDRSFLPSDGRPVSARLTFQHPLQPFSPRYFQGDPDFFTYAAAYRPPLAASEPKPFCAVADVPSPSADAAAPHASPEQVGRQQQDAAQPVSDVELAELIAFWKHPVRAYCEQTLCAHVPYVEDDLPEEETLEPDGRERLRLRQRLLERQYPQWLGLTDSQSAPSQDAPEFDSGTYAYLTACGELPPQQLGRMFYGCLRAEVEDFARHLQPYLEHQRPVSCAFAFSLEAFTLHGRLDGVTGQGQVLWRPARLTAADRVNAWVRHLVWCALPEEQRPAGVPGRTILMGLDGQQVLEPVADARARLGWLCALRRTGLERPLPFFLRSSFAYAQECLPLPPGSRRKPRPEYAARMEWAGSDFSSMAGECEDPYIALCFPASCEDATGATAAPVDGLPFAELARAFWLPFFDCVS